MRGLHVSWVRLAMVALVVGLTLGGGLWWRHVSRPNYRLRRGQEALRRGDVEQAERLANRLEASGHPDHALLLRGEASLRCGDLDAAIHAFNAIGDQGEIAIEASALYGQWFLLRLHKPVEAERFLRYVVSRRHDHVDAHRGLAALYYDQCAWATALMHLKAWGELDRRDGRPYRLTGLIYKNLDEPKAAIPAYREALGRMLEPHVAQEVRQELAECLMAQSQYEEALGVLKSCSPEAGKTARLQAVHAECLWGLGRAAKAREFLDHTLTRYPQAIELLRLRARLHLAAHEPQAAVSLLEPVVAVNVHDPAYCYLLAQAYEALGRSDKAAEQRHRAERIQEVLKHLSLLVQEAGDRPWDVSLHRRVADLCEELGRPDQARLWRRAAECCVLAEMDNVQKSP